MVRYPSFPDPSKAPKSTSILSPAALLHWVRAQLGTAIAERWVAVSLDANGRPLGLARVDPGRIPDGVPTPRTLFSGPLCSMADSVQLVVSEPRRPPTLCPTQLDGLRRLQLAGSLLGLDLTDVLLVGRKGWVSLVEAGLLEPAPSGLASIDSGAA